MYVCVQRCVRTGNESTQHYVRGERTQCYYTRDFNLHTYIISHYNPSVRIMAWWEKLPLMLCALILYVSGGTCSLSSTPNRRFLRYFFIASLLTLIRKNCLACAERYANIISNLTNNNLTINQNDFFHCFNVFIGRASLLTSSLPSINRLFHN